MDLHVWRSSESENRIFSVWFVCVCASICLCFCVTVISITQKQITAETWNLVFYICIKYRCFLKLFIKIGQNSVYRNTQKNSNTLRPMDKIPCWFNLISLDCTRYKILDFFRQAKNSEHVYVTAIMLHACLPILAWRKLGLRFFYPKQMLPFFLPLIVLILLIKH